MYQHSQFDVLFCEVVTLGRCVLIVCHQVSVWSDVWNVVDTRFFALMGTDDLKMYKAASCFKTKTVGYASKIRRGIY